MPDGKHFLRAFRFEGERTETVLKVETNREQDLDAQQREAEKHRRYMAELRKRLASR